MNILIDTNIIIPLEDTGRELDSKYADMRQLISQFGYILFVHPIQKEDIHRDKTEERRRIL